MSTKLPSGVSSTSLQALDPSFAPKVSAMLAALSAQGWQPRIVSGWRSIDEQAKLKAMGRSTVSFSFHNAVNASGQPAALAVDVVDKRYGYGTTTSTKDGAARFWPALGAAAKAQGLFWGGDWKSFKDVSHVQMHPNSALGEIRKQSEAAWAAVRGIVGGTTSVFVAPVLAVQGWFEIVRRLPWWWFAGIGAVGLLLILFVAKRAKHRSAASA